MSPYPAARRFFRFSGTVVGLISGRKTRVQLTPNMGVDVNGIAAAALLTGVALVAKTVLPWSRAWLLPAAAAVPVTAFFRDPTRRTPTDSDAVVAAADGRVLSIGHVTDERLGAGEWLRIAVFLSVLDVHVNRSPVSGRVLAITESVGGYAAAQTSGAEHNVAQYTLLETSRGKVGVAQRSGLVARRIVNRAQVGKRLNAGERFGLIRFGSRTDVYLPVGAALPCVAVGDRVLGGETIIARWKR
ncbi:MAG: phosphatidylserine decarboxylase family protein [Acidimicrobiales bacterium]|nr:MAG: phosphatidylserine decarboxylase family protein [Acidimicrobiales bacterium]